MRIAIRSSKKEARGPMTDHKLESFGTRGGRETRRGKCHDTPDYPLTSKGSVDFLLVKVDAA